MAWLATSRKIGDHKTRWWADETSVAVRCFGCGLRMKLGWGTLPAFGVERGTPWSQCAEVVLELMFHNQPVKCEEMKKILRVREVLESGPTPASVSATTGFPGGDRTTSLSQRAGARAATLWPSSFQAHILTIPPERRRWSLTDFDPYRRTAGRRGT